MTMEAVASEHSLKPTFLRKDVGGGYCFHVDLSQGLVGFSQRESLDDDAARPPHPEIWMTDEKALALFKTLEAIVKNKKLIPGREPSPKPPPVAQSATPFLQANHRAIITHKTGMMKSPPWWLRWLYSAIVTKEQYRDY